MSGLYDSVHRAANLTGDNILAFAAEQLTAHRKLRLSVIDTRESNAQRVLAKLPGSHEAMNPLLFDVAFGADADTPQILGGDVCILVLDATQLLSQRERELIRDVLIPCFGTKRLCIVLARMEQIPQDETGEVYNYLHVFLESEKITVLQADELSKYLQKDLLSETEEIVLETEKTILAAAITSARKKLVELDLVKQLNQNDLTAAHKRLDELFGLVKRMSGKTAYKGVAFARSEHVKLIGAIDKYAVRVKKTVQTELEMADDLTVAQRHISGYLSYLWQTFLSDAQDQLQHSFADYASEAEKDMMADIAELTASIDETTANILTAAMIDHIDNSVTRVFIGKRAEQNEGLAKLFGSGVTGLSKAMTVASGILLLVNLPYALGTFAASHLVKVIFKDKVVLEKRADLIDSTLKACDKLSSSVRIETARAMGKIETEIKTRIQDAYNNAFEKLNAQLDMSERISESERQYTSLQSIISELNTLLEQRKPFAPAAL